MHIIFRSSTYGDPDFERAAWSIIQSSTRTLRRRTGSLIADLVEADRLHASTACKAHPVGYRDIPRGLSSFTWRRPFLQPITPEQPAPEQPASSTCSSVADVGANPSLPAAVCRWCHQLLFNMQQCGRRGCKSLSTCSGVPMVPPPSLQHSTFSAET